MTIHRKLDVSAGFVADSDWATANVSPEAASGGGIIQIRGLDQAIKVPRAGVELLWSCTYYNGAGANAASVAAGAATFSGEVVYETGAAEPIYKAQTAVAGIAVKQAVIESDLPVQRKCWVRLSAAGATPVGATHIWITFDFVERRGT
jgi:hypothetical protein